jgi:hypothetical protein
MSGVKLACPSVAFNGGPPVTHPCREVDVRLSRWTALRLGRWDGGWGADRPWLVVVGKMLPLFGRRIPARFPRAHQLIVTRMCRDPKGLGEAKRSRATVPAQPVDAPLSVCLILEWSQPVSHGRTTLRAAPD